MYSIYHFFKSLIDNKKHFATMHKLEDFPFEKSLLSCRSKGQFPDMAIRLNKKGELFTGGELIELKDSNHYTISSFNSTIPMGRKEISRVTKGQNSIIRQQMEDAGDSIDSLPIRDVFYLIRGRKKENIKVLLMHGSFFETIKTSELISQSFSQVLEERIGQSGIQVNDDVKELLISMFSEQDNFSKVRIVDKASVKLRFRIMTEIKSEGNILNSNKYPEIENNTINFILPYHTEKDRDIAIKCMTEVFGNKGLRNFKELKLKHHFNGYFLIFQQSLND